MSNLSPELLSQRKKMQMEAILKESDLKKNQRDTVQAEIKISDLKHKQVQLQMEMVLEENLLKKLASDRIMLQAEIIKMKHQINNLGR